MLSSPDIHFHRRLKTLWQSVFVSLLHVVACIGRRGESHPPIAFNNLSITLLSHPYNEELKPRKRAMVSKG